MQWAPSLGEKGMSASCRWPHVPSPRTQTPHITIATQPDIVRGDTLRDPCLENLHSIFRNGTLIRLSGSVERS
jgi:hypothetical protein